MKRLVFVLVGAAAMAIVAVATSFSVNVELGRFGDADGTFVYGDNGSSGSVNALSCLALSGNRAVIGGILASGTKYLWYAVDNGTPASGVRDQVRPLLQLEPADLAQLPAGFPRVCPSPDTVLGGFPYSDVTEGDIVIRDVR